jgi:hypothetical protein
MFKPFEKKKPGMGVVIAIGGKGRPAPESPDSLEAPKPTGRALPFKPVAAAPDPNQDPNADSPHETAESPAEEGNEEAGAKLISNIDSLGEQHGLDSTASRAFAADLFGAISECLRRDSEGGDTGGYGDEAA